MKRNKAFTIAVIGGGAGGLFAAVHAALAARQQNTSVSIHIFEKNPSVGKKLAITGSSQCNITHESSVREMAEHYFEHEREMLSLLSRFSPSDTMTFFTGHGLSLTTREDGKVFPSSLDAREVIETLTSILKEHAVQIHTSSPVSAVTKEEQQYRIILPEGDFLCDALIIATGGFTYQNTGSTGDGYRLAQSLGHHVVTPRLSLSPVKVTSRFSSSLSGISIDDAAVSVDEKVRSTGSLLFTHTGLSGPVVLHSSRYMKGQDRIRVSYVTESEQVTAEKIKSLCNRDGKKQLITLLLDTGVPRRLLEFILSSNNIEGTRKGAEIGKKDIQKISRDLTGMTFDISLKGMNSRAMVSAGGVSLAEIDLRTMESKITPHLYFCGEVLDLDGETGGYNLQAAWSSGAMAGTNCITTI